MSFYFRRSILTLLWLIVALLLLMSLMSYSANDPSWSHVSSLNQPVSNLVGEGGAWLSDMLYTFLGVSSWWLIVITCYEAWRVWYPKTEPMGVFRTLGYVFLLIGSAGLTGLLTFSWLHQGIIGQVVASGLAGLLSHWIALLFLLVFSLITLVFSFNLDVKHFWQTYIAKSANQSAEQATDTLADDGLANDKKTGKKSTDSLQLPLPLPAHDEVLASNHTVDMGYDSPLDDFLDETGFSDAKEYAWMDSDDGSNPFRPISSAHLANTKLTKKIDAKLQNEVITNKTDPFKRTEPVKPTTMPQHTTDDSEEMVIVSSPVLLPDHWDNQANTPTPPPPPVEEPISVAKLLGMQTYYPVPNLAEQEVYPQADYQKTHSDTVDIYQDNDGGAADDSEPMAFMAKPVADVIVEPTVQPVISAPQPVAQAQKIDTAKRPSVDHRSVEIGIIPAEAPLDIHNDALFASKSRAMQTAQYRASLSPLPELSLLELPDPNQQPSYSREQLQQLSELLEIKLQEFNIKANVVNAQLGPVVTRFEVELAPGVKASKVTGISKDLARSLSMASVRVVEVIPGKPYIGIEVPNPNRQMVRLIELLKTEAFADPNGLLSMAMGKDISGKPVIADLAKAPHMLVAGTTGSGKSVLVNSLLLSLLLKYTPEQLRLILIDPKQLELANYNDIPHLLTPVVTDMTEAASALSWCVAEMERRYQLMSLFKVRKLDEYNKKVIASEQQGHPLLDPLWRMHDSVSQDKPPKLKPLPQIVIVADEFADMIMQVGKQAEELITRLAQKSRAAGIHLILATQRPSVDVITGLIKANIPVRAALRVNSKVDSRTILDAGGAEDMLGHGDMLFLAPSQNEPTRVHGAFISDAEVNSICDAWRERGSPDYIDNMFDNFELTSPSGSDSGGIGTGDEDALYDDVVAFVLETRKVSASSIQRKFSIGYNRAARIVDAMEAGGLVSGMGKSGKRELLV